MPVEHNNDVEGRLWLRFPPVTPETWVIVAGERKHATILDESYGGLGMMMEMEDAVDVQADDALLVLHCDYPTPCRVQWIQRNQETQKVCLGIRWTT
ncbi:MAG: hypothetical protein ACLP9L_06245 [Thermoguttaceae bacterium]